MNLLLRILAAAGVVFVPFFASACDICGCGGGGNSMGLLPLVQRHFVGIRWQSQSFRTDAHAGEPNSTEIFRTLDLWGRWQPHRRVQVIGNLPFQFSDRRFEYGANHQVKRLGDAGLLAQFAALDPRKQAVRTWQHTLQFGGGIKLPTGKYDLKDGEGFTLAPAVQPGSGSFDLTLGGLYALRRGDWGASLDATVKLSGKNERDFQFGNRLNAGFRGFWTKKVGKTAFLPFAGLMLDARNADRQNGKWQSETGGWGLFGMAGAEVFFGNVSFSAGWQMPVASDFSEGKVSPKTRFNASVALLFGGKKKPVEMAMPMIFPEAEK